ncbi:MAG TPA: hypothetical protein VKV57_13420 [bacterium]|nr:hypothetical protein [bacterium]
MKWVALISTVGMGAIFLAGLLAFTFYVSRLSKVVAAPGWFLPHLAQVLIVIDIVIAVGLGVTAIVLLRMRSE